MGIIFGKRLLLTEEDESAFELGSISLDHQAVIRDTEDRQRARPAVVALLWSGTVAFVPEIRRASRATCSTKFQPASTCMP